jgi:divalent metal cation (Fe/Co/Zn/Cd) transporter
MTIVGQSNQRLISRARFAECLTVAWMVVELVVALALAALIIMPLLWRWRLALAVRLDSPALRADSACSLVCVYLSAALMAGLLLNALLGWWWADPLAALAMIFWIRGEAAEALEAAKTGRHEDDE